MKCWCGAPTWIVYTRTITRKNRWEKEPAEYVTRRRECFNLHRFTTDETARRRKETP